MGYRRTTEGGGGREGIQFFFLASYTDVVIGEGSIFFLVISCLQSSICAVHRNIKRIVYSRSPQFVTIHKTPCALSGPKPKFTLYAKRRANWSSSLYGSQLDPVRSILKIELLLLLRNSNFTQNQSNRRRPTARYSSSARGNKKREG